MSGLILSILKEAASLLIQGQAAKRTVQHGIGTIVFYCVVGSFGVAALIFFYIGLYRVIADSTSAEAAAGILCAGNLVVIGVLLLGRSIAQGRKAPAGFNFVSAHPSNRWNIPPGFGLAPVQTSGGQPRTACHRPSRAAP